MKYIKIKDEEDKPLKIFIKFSPKCTCGAEKVGSSFHSDWCDLAEEEE